MKKVFVSQDLVEVEMLKECLEQAGIPCTIKNQQTSTLAGGLPFAEVFPELWVLKDEDHDRAKELLKIEATGSEATQTAWRCPGCGELHSNEFTTCWKCGRSSGSDSKPDSRFVPESDGPPRKTSSNLQILMAFVLGIVVALSGTALWNYFSIKHMPTDRNGDGKNDVIFSYTNGVLREARYDNDFDGYFETHCEYNRKGALSRCTIDRDHDGKPDVVEEYSLDNLLWQDFLDKETGRVVKRAFFKLGIKVREEIDQDGDGTFERIIHFDKFESAID